MVKSAAMLRVSNHEATKSLYDNYFGGCLGSMAFQLLACP